MASETSNVAPDRKDEGKLRKEGTLDDAFEKEASRM
jgi:hypothetical protein